MLLNIKQLYVCKLAASDGEVGRIKDFYFDDKSWAVRYLVADTGTWLSGRQVLLSPHAFGRWNRAGNVLPLNLTRKQIEGGPAIASHEPVSRQHEIDYFRHYGWPAYWYGGGMWGIGPFPLATKEVRAEAYASPEHRQADLNLRSTKAVTGYQIHAVDGVLGTVSGFKVDDQNWAILDLVVEAGHWYAGKEILIPVSNIERISYEGSTVFVTLTEADLQRTLANTVAKAAS